ncbi:hypothetical protein B0H13DRAFT_2197988, partial [Mycena leptocephala]
MEPIPALPLVHTRPYCEATEILELITKNEAEISELDAQMLEKVLDLAGLAAQKPGRQHQLALLWAALSPVARLPAELLVHIFTCCLDSTLHLFYDVISPNNAPMVLTHVCSRWRAIALTTPRLWENMSLRLDEDPRSRASFLPEVLLRSRPHPLFVDIRASLTSTFSEFENVLLMGRARTLKLQLPSASLLSFGGLPEGSLSALHTLHILDTSRRYIDEEIGIIPWMNIIPAFTTLPELRRLILSLEALGQPPNIFTAQFPWAQLTYLNLGVPLEVIAARTILAQCVNLVDGSLWGLLSSEDDSAPSDLVTLPNLRRFLFGLADERVTVHTLFDILI